MNENADKVFLKNPEDEVGDIREYAVVLELDPFDLHGRHHEIPEAAAKVSVTRLSEGFHVEVEVRATVLTTCDRTLEDVEVPVEFGDSEFVETPDYEDLSVSEWEMDVKAYANEALPPEVPMQVFAPGTEPVVQQEDDDGIDPRWKGLGGLFASGF